MVIPPITVPIPGINSKALKDKIKGPPVEILSKEGLENTLTKVNERVITLLGAGDIGAEVETIKHKLMLYETI